jgi:succinyl-CoA synthetase beta subunit
MGYLPRLGSLFSREAVMKIHEFQAKNLLRAAGVPVLAGHVARTPDEAAAAFTALGTPVCAVKAQIHAGGRGKGKVQGSEQRGVELAKSADDARRIAGGPFWSACRMTTCGAS